MSAAAISTFNVWRDRRQARQGHDPIETQDRQPEPHPLQDIEETQPVSTHSSDIVPMIEAVPADEDNDNIENGLTTEEPESPTETTPAVASVRTRPSTSTSRRVFTLADLEEERELGRRRTSFCVMLAAFVLFRLWIEALVTGDFFLLMMCLLGTSWTARFIRHTREREAELDRLITEYNDNQDGDGEGVLERNELTRLSFRAQLAMAIINSQRDVMEGGFGHPDGSVASAGLSQEAKESWDRFRYKAASGGGNCYGSVPQGVDDLEKGGKSNEDSVEEEPHCSICLGEYEEGEELVCLPCKHIYHEDCVGSWCSNHGRCPLCNFDLESVTNESSSSR